MRRQEPRLLVPPVDLQQARRLKVVRRLGVVLADCVETEAPRGRCAQRNPASAVIGRSTTHLNPAGSSYRDPTSVWCDTTACAGSMAFSKNAAQPYGMSLTCQWLRTPRPEPRRSCRRPRSPGRVTAGSCAPRARPPSPPSPHAHTSPAPPCVGRVNAHDRGFALTRSSSAGERRLGHVRALAFAVEPPRVVRAEQACRRPRRGPLRAARAGAGTCPRTTLHLSVAVLPHHDVFAEQRAWDAAWTCPAGRSPRRGTTASPS